MPATITAPSRAHRPLRAFDVSLRFADRHLDFTALARSSCEALCNALDLPDLAPPVSVSVKPVGTSADALRLYRLKLALADLVE